MALPVTSCDDELWGDGEMKVGMEVRKGAMAGDACSVVCWLCCGSQCRLVVSLLL